MNPPSSIHTSTSFEKDAGIRNLLIQGKVRSIDILFPLFNTIYQQCSVLVPLFYVTAFYWGIQAMFLVMWPMSEFWDESNMSEIQWTVFKYMKAILLFITSPHDSKKVLIKEAVFFIANILSFLLILMQLLYYNIHRSFIKYLLNPVQSYDAVTLIGVLPSAVVFGESFQYLTNGQSDIYTIFSLILSIFNVIYMLVYHYVILRLTAKSVSLQNLPFLSFDPFMTYALITAIAVIIMVTYVIMYFVEWAYLVSIVVHFCVFAYIFSQTIHMLYLIHSSNSLFFGLSFTFCVLDIVMFVVHFVQDLNNFVPMIITFCCIVISCNVGLIFFHFRRKKVIEILSETDPSMEEDKTPYFDSLKLATNDKKALMFLSVGFANACPMFYDLSLMEYLAVQNPSSYILANMLQIINYFPGEHRFLNRITGMLMSNRQLLFDQRFLIYQIYKIKTLRQFSSSTDSNLKLNELKNMSRQVESMTRSALETTNLKPGFYEELAIKAKRANAIWVEALCDYPNNPKFCDEYCRYLVECEANYPESLRIKHRGSLIEMGKNYSFDYSFRSMVKLFPIYLKKEIIDLRGNLKAKPKLNASQSSSSIKTENITSNSGSGSNGSHNLSISSDIDDEIQEQIGKQTFTQHKARLALHRALENKLPSSVKCIIPTGIITLIIVTFLFLFVFLYTRFELYSQTDSMAMLDAMSKTRFYLALNDMEIILRYMVDLGSFKRYNQSLINLASICDSKEIIVDPLKDYLYQTLHSLNNAMDEFSLLINMLADISDNRDTVFKVAGNLVLTQHPTITCYNGEKAYIINDTISSMISIFFAHQSYILTRVYDDISDMFDTTQFCELLINLKVFYTLVPQVFSDFSDYQVDQGDKLKKNFEIILYTVPALIAVVSFIPLLIIHLMTMKSIKDVTTLIMSFDPKTRADAKEIITVNVENDDTKLAEMSMSSSRSGWMIFLLVIFAVLFVVLSTLMTIFAKDSNNDIINLNVWDQYATLRLSLSAETMNTFVFGISMFDNPGKTSLSNATSSAMTASGLLQLLLKSNNDLLQGTDSSPPCTNFDQQLDDENINDKQVNHTSMDAHSLYSGASINTQLKILADYLKQIALNMFGTPPLAVTPFAHAVHIFSSHLAPKLFNVTQRLRELAKVTYDKLMLNIGLILIPAFIMIILYGVVVSQYFVMRRDAYRAALFILKRINPHALINNKLFIKQFLNNTNDVHEENKTVSGNILHNAPDAILCTNIHGVVEIVNPATTSLLGYTPEQLLGQPVPAFFIQVDEDRINQQLDMMRNGQASSFYEDNITAITDASQFMPCHITILGMKPANSSTINSFVVILRDQTQLNAQQQQAEEAKAQSEKLLYQILPRDIVVQINRGEKDISFTVPSATIIFIDIVKFSEYSAALTPQEIMANLSLYFGTVDDLLSKYNLLTKIKLIGDIYMAAAGLFNPETPAEKHAEQMIMFATEVILELDEINIRLNASLSVRAGINSGGPIIAGVLGKDKPVFDIIGDPINVAARLQSTDEANFVQISQATYDLVNHLNFDIKPRGEVFLKGKGKQMTYLVSPNPLVNGANMEFSS